MLTYQCPTCQAKFEAEMSNGKVVYEINNKRTVIKSHEDDCEDCKEELRQAQETRRAEIKAQKKI